jgi:nucleotide-binding universal stress UspA family protein
MQSLSYESILVPTDMSDFGKLALRYAALFQQKLGSRLTLLFADEFYFPLDLLELPLGYYLENAPDAKMKLHEKLRDYITENCALGAEALVMQDAPSRAIVSVAKQSRSDLVIMGTHGRRGWRRALLGSVTESVLREIDCPVLTVTPAIMPNEGDLAIRTILSPVNFTHVAREALQHASALAAAFDADLVVMYVAEGIDQPMLPQLDTAFSQWIDPHVRDRCRYSQIVIRSGDPAEHVLNMSGKLGADLIVIGAQHKWFSDATVIGTTTERITRFAKCPVLTVVRKAVVERPVEDELLVETAN